MDFVLADTYGNVTIGKWLIAELKLMVGKAGYPPHQILKGSSGGFQDAPASVDSAIVAGGQ